MVIKGNRVVSQTVVLFRVSHSAQKPQPTVTESGGMPNLCFCNGPCRHLDLILNGDLPHFLHYAACNLLLNDLEINNSDLLGLMPDE